MPIIEKILKIARERKIILGLILVVFLLTSFLIPLHQAKAAWWWSRDWAGDATKAAIIWLFGGIFQFFLWFLGLAGMLLDAFFSIESYTNTPLVIEGWKIVRDFSNIFFIFILMIIAFGTILGKETYGMKALLPKLIIIALLINFSLAIGGVIIDFSQVFLHYFVDTAKNIPSCTTHPTVTACLAANLNLAELITKSRETDIKTEGALEQLKGALDDGLKTIISLFAGIIFIILAIFVYLGGFALLFWRMISLWTLLIGAPIIWLASILPDTNKYWTQWWDNFIKQCLVGPVYFFFVYLAIVFIGNKGLLAMAKESSAVSFGIQYFALISIMMMGLVLAPELGGKGTAAIMGGVDKLRKGVGKWAKGAGLATGAAAVGSKYGQKAIDWMATKPGLRRIAEPLRGVKGMQIQAQEAKIEKAEKKAKSLTSDQIKKEYGVADKETKIAMAKILNERGNLDAAGGFTDDVIKQTIKNMEAMNPSIANQMKLNRLDLVEPGDINDVIAKAKPADMEKIQGSMVMIPNVLAGIRTALQSGKWKVPHLENLARENLDVAEKININIIQPELSTGGGFSANPMMKRYLEGTAGKALGYGLPPVATPPPPPTTP